MEGNLGRAEAGRARYRELMVRASNGSLRVAFAFAFASHPAHGQDRRTDMAVVEWHFCGPFQGRSQVMVQENDICWFETPFRLGLSCFRDGSGHFGGILSVAVHAGRTSASSDGCRCRSEAPSGGASVHAPVRPCLSHAHPGPPATSSLCRAPLSVSAMTKQIDDAEAGGWARGCWGCGRW